MAAALITRVTNAMAVIVSERSVVGIFEDGEIISEIIPELWLLQRHGFDGAYSTREMEQMKLVSQDDKT